MKKNLVLLDENSDECIFFCPELIKFFKVEKNKMDEAEKLIEKMEYLDENKETKCDKNSLKQLTIDVVDSCNLKCKYCYALEGTYGKKVKFTSIEQMIAMYHDICKEYKFGVENICFFGGEPMLGFNTVKKFVIYVKKYNLKHKLTKTKFSMITNGTLIKDEDWDFFVNNNFVLTISLDGDKATNDSMRIYKNANDSVYDKVSSLMLKNKKNNLFVFCEATLTPTFFDKYNGDINSYIKNFLDLGFDGFFPFVAEGELLHYTDEIMMKMSKFYEDFVRFWLSELTKIESKIYDKMPFIIVNLIRLLTTGEKSVLCGAGRNTVFCGTDGLFYKCQMYYKNGEQIRLSDLKPKIKYKPELKECKGCISKNVCLFWCEGGAREFGNKNHVSKTRCIVQNAMTITICKWLINLSLDDTNILCDRLEKTNLKFGGCL